MVDLAAGEEEAIGKVFVASGSVEGDVGGGRSSDEDVYSAPDF